MSSRNPEPAGAGAVASPAPGGVEFGPMTTRRKKRACILCGGSVTGRGDVCSSCSGEPATEGSTQRVAERVRDRISGRKTGLFVCPFCRYELDWGNVGMVETEVTIYVREKIYYCPECRAFLGVSSWHTEG